MPKKKEENKEEVFFVGMKDPIEIRRSLLESSKEMVQYLQRAERFKKVRAEKAEEIAKLKATIREIHSLVRKLKAKLPKTKIRAKLHSHEKKYEKEAVTEKLAEEIIVKKPVKATAPKVEKKKSETELEKLEKELGEIESRLTRLS